MRHAPVARTGDGAAQTSCVAVVQVVVRHGWPERYADGLRSLLEKPRPLIVTVPALETWRFIGAKEETATAVLQPPHRSVNTVLGCAPIYPTRPSSAQWMDVRKLYCKWRASFGADVSVSERVHTKNRLMLAL